MKLPHILIIMTLFFSCSSKKQTVSNQVPESVNGKWQLDVFQDEPIDKSKYTERLPFIELNTITKNVKGSTGCNSFFGAIETISNQTIQFSPFGMTRMGCDEFYQESSMMAAFSKCNTYKVLENKLLFYADKEILFEFTSMQ